MVLDNYVERSSKLKLKPNKKQIKAINIYFDKYEEWNEIALYCKKHYLEVKPTLSGAMPINKNHNLRERYMIVLGNQRAELTIACAKGLFRFVLKPKAGEHNPVTGRQADQIFYSKCDEYGINISEYMITNGKDVKKEILPPHIQILNQWAEGRVTENVHHLDLNSAYASQIIKEYPELTEVYNDLYHNRHNDDDKYKHVLTNSIGSFQSETCVDPTDRRRANPYCLANFSKIAINGTRAIIEYYIEKLRKSGRVPLLSNTDGIWYSGDIYHDKNEGSELGQWKTDHKNCIIYIKSTGAYQFLEDGKCNTVVRGITAYDAIEPDREKWEWLKLKEIDNIATFKFNKEKGIMEKLYEEI